jgi:hypothetical protein
MKKTILFLLGISIASVAFARGHHTPKPAPIPAPTAASGFCINYGEYTQSYDLSANGQVAQDLATLKAANITCLRLAYYTFNFAPSESLALFAQSKGFSVILGGGWWANGSSVISPSNLATYTSEVMQQAAWAQANGIPQMSLGNEQEYYLNGITDSQWASYITGLAAQVKTVYSGKVSYETSGDFADEWATQSLGSLDLLGVNLYCGYQCNLNYATELINHFGASHVYISETNCDMTNVASCSNDASHAAEVEGDAVQLLKLGIPEYYFAYSGGSADGVPTYWGLFNGTNLQQPLTAAVLGIK